MSSTQGLTALSMVNDIVEYYKVLRTTGKLDINGPGNEITQVITRYIQPGMSFSEAEEVLRIAGFRVSSRPQTNVGGTRSDRFDVYAISNSIISPTEILIGLSPSSPGDYTIIKMVYGLFITTAL